MLLQACLGLTIHARRNQVRLDHPFLPESLTQVNIRNLPVKDTTVDLTLERYGEVVGVNVKRRDGGVEIVTVV